MPPYFFMKMNIVIIGFMGAGKSTFAQNLSQSLKFQLTALDHEIERSTKMSIDQIFADKGEAYFRKNESDLLLESMKKEDMIIDCGGGILEITENQKALSASQSLIVYMFCPWNIIWQRIKDTNRPLLKNKSEQDIHQLYLRRVPLYQKFANLHIDSILPYQDQLNVLLKDLKNHIDIDKYLY